MGDFSSLQEVNTAKAWGEMESRLTDPIIPDENSDRQKSFREAVQFLYTTVQRIAELRQQNRSDGQDLLIDIISDSATDEDVLQHDLVTYLVASYHTTANLLVWATYFLSIHPEVQNKLYMEIIQVLGETDVVTASNFEQLGYMNQVLEETLRCAVLAPWAARVQDFDSELGGHNIPKNTPVIHALGVVLQDERIWPEPQRFDPDRFSVENRKSRSPYAFSPFGFAGKRQCPGYKFSLMQSTSIMATLFRKFNVSLWEDQLVQPVFGLVTPPREEIWLKLTKRK